MVSLNGGKAGTTPHRHLVAAQRLRERASHVPMWSLCYQAASFCYLLGSTQTGLVHGVQLLFGYTLILPGRLQCSRPPFKEIQGPPCTPGTLSKEAPVLPRPLSARSCSARGTGRSRSAPLGRRPGQVRMLGAMVNSAPVSSSIILSLAGGGI